MARERAEAPAKNRAGSRPARSGGAPRSTRVPEGGQPRKVGGRGGRPRADKRDDPAVTTDGTAPPTEEAAAEENPLHKKFGLRPGLVGLVVAPPPDDDNPLLPLPAGFVVLTGLDDLASAEGPFAYLHVFARDRGDLAAAFGLLRDKLAPGGSLWISWMKQADSRGTAMMGDLNENVIRRLALTHGLVDVKVAALDRAWSALRLVHRKR
jgi:hypothetical protein